MTRLDNAAVRFVDRLIEAFERQDRDVFLDLHASGFVHEDRRSGIRQSTTLEEILRYRDTSIELGISRSRVIEVVAIRGDRLSLTRRMYTTPDADYEIEQLIVDEVDQDGRVVRAIVFDPDDESHALEELDARYVAGEGAPYGAILTLAAEQRRALQSGDWDAYRKVIHDDVVLVDHRPVSLGEVRGADQVIASTRAFFDLVHDRRTRILAIHAIALDRIAAEQIGTGRSDDGGEIESHLIRLQLVREGRVARIELFPGDQVHAALQRFQEI